MSDETESGFEGESESEDEEWYVEHEIADKSFFDAYRLQEIFHFTAIEKPDELRNEEGEVYDITGLSAVNVVAVMASIINNPNRWKKLQKFFLL